VFGNSIDLNKVAISKEGALNSIVFGVQDFFKQLSAGNFSGLTDETDSRAFVTGNLINFDVDEDLERYKLIHELTHVWQNQNVGPIYLAHAVESQIFGAGYNYGYDDPSPSVSIPVDYAGTVKNLQSGQFMGEGAQVELINAGGNFSSFNPEQQGQIAMHFFVRKVLLNQNEAQFAPWQPYINVIQAGMPERLVA
jgi:hypothetical protein